MDTYLFLAYIRSMNFEKDKRKTKNVEGNVRIHTYICIHVYINT